MKNWINIVLLVALSFVPSAHTGGGCSSLRKKSSKPSALADVPAEVLNDYEFTQGVLGKGAFGFVRLAQDKNTKQMVAVKILQRRQYEKNAIPYPPLEPTLLAKLSHPNICRLLRTIETSNALTMVMELVEGKELFAYVYPFISESAARRVMRQIVAGVDYMHRSGIVHRDLKLENVMINKASIIKIVDFGFAHSFAESDVLKTSCGSPDYAAPEIYVSHMKGYNGFAVDVWAMGVMLFAMVAGQMPFEDLNALIDIDYDWPEMCDFSDPLRFLIDRIFQPAQSRCSMESIIRSDWLNACGTLPPIERL
jgi:serine/threonine protein kinase